MKQRNSTLDETRVITCWVKEKEQKLINANAITRNNATAMFCDPLTLSNRYNGVDLMFLFKEGLSLSIRGFSFNSNTKFLFSLVSTLKLSKDGKWLQSNKL